MNFPFQASRLTVLALLTTLTLSAIVACKSFGKKEQPTTNIKNKPDTNMPISALPSAPGDYPEDWKIVDSLQAEGLYKSALEKTEAIYARAQKDKNGQQIVKALLYRGKFITMLDEDGLTNAINLMEKESLTAAQPEKSVLQSILGQLYATYLQNQSWTIKQRTPIPEGEGGDILTWSASQLEKHALALYDASVSQDALLRGIQITQFRDVLTPGANDSIGKQPLRPTLFDLLAHRALAHFSNERSYLTEPAYAFQLDQENDFAPYSQFVQNTYETKDTDSEKWRAIRLFQKVLGAHSTAPGLDQASRKPALIDADLLRLQFVYGNSVLENKSALYLKALENLKKSAEGYASQAEISYQIAAHLYGMQYENAADKARQAENAKRAVAELKEAIQRYPGSYGAQISQNLLKDIERPEVSTTVESVILPDQAVLVQLSYRNLKKVWVRVVKLDFDRERWKAIPYNEQYDFLKKQKPVQTKSWDIQDPSDYQQHQTEIYLDKLPVGNYWVIVSSSNDLEPITTISSYANFAVSNLAAVQYQEDGQTQYVVAHRNTGVPLADVQLSFFRTDWETGVQRLKLVTTATSDRDGFVSGKNIPVGQGLQVLARQGADSLWIGQAYAYRQGGEPTIQPQVMFFTDRSMYRPGQTVYFKGILFSPGYKSGKIPTIIPNRSITVRFHDANRQVKSTLKLKSNEFGTFNGTFTAPTTGLMGSMSIQASDGAQGSSFFFVEEYKRPRFEVTMKPVEGAIRLNETVTVKGEAKNYAGSVLDGAQVKYRVVRVARFPYWDYMNYWRKVAYSDSPSMEIANGTTVSGADGSFAINFKAIPDATIPKKDKPVFDYQVYVDVTDITGETHSSQAFVSVGYVALQVIWNLPDAIALDSLKKIGLSTTNMAGQPQAAAGTISIQKLVAPKILYRKRFWEQPDLPVIPKATFESMFPDLAWKDEDNPATWGREDFTRTVKFNTGSAQNVDLHEGRMQEGWYVITLRTTDSNGEAIEIEKFVRAWGPGNRFEYPGIAAEKTTLEPGETARFVFGGKDEGLHFFFTQMQNGNLLKPDWVSGRVKNLASVEIPIMESDRGGIPTYSFCVKNNRIYGINNIFLTVPWSNKDLNISYETFRDKLAPGQQEEWRIKISGPKKEKVAAEMVAAMYDASLDQFSPHSWSEIPFPVANNYIHFETGHCFGIQTGINHLDYSQPTNNPYRSYQELNLFDFPIWGRRREYMMSERMMMAAPAGEGRAMKKMDEEEVADAVAGNMAAGKPGGPPMPQAPEPIKPDAPKPEPGIRKNLNETVFFFPDLRTDADGNIILKFKMNEALTRWKLLTYTHTKDLQQVRSVKEVVTQKELMIIANPPRFLRQGDDIEISAKVSNLSANKLEGNATLTLLNALDASNADAAFGLAKNNRIARFSILPGQSGAVSWRIKVPDDYAGAITWQITAAAGNFQDGEESTIPVVSNRMLVTETMPIALRGNQSRTFTFDNLKAQPENGSLSSHKYTLEFTSNPVWYAVQSLPYLMEYPHECSEQIFSRMYANTLASSVVEKMPQIKRVYERWKGTDAMKSNLSKNQELKYALLEETPWVLDAQNEEQQKQNIALLFDLNKMASEQEKALRTLKERQLGTGGWPWFTGGPDNWYITQYIATGFMHLRKLGAIDLNSDPQTDQMLDKAMNYCQRKLNDQYERLEKEVQKGNTKWENDHLDGMAIQFLYLQSFVPMDRPSKQIGYYLGQAEKYWLGKGLYQEGMLALALHRFGRKEAAQRIVASLRERATMKDELGMYWPVDWGFYWYQMPVETQALMVEVFSEVANDQKSVEELRIWLLKNKQTNRWESTKATAEAVYALLLNNGQANSWLSNTQTVKVSIGGKPMKVDEVEPGSGYFKQAWNGSEVKRSWADIKVDNPNSNIVWGAAYWQYFEDLDKIKDFKKTPLTIVKQLYLEENSATGPVLKAISEGQSLKRGDKVKVRIEIRVDRPMEFVHLKDMRAAGLEPVNVLSGYRWQGGLGYYESTRDLATHFFIDYLPTGTYVFEYPLVVSLRGDMSNGITTMQCMYAPEFTSHSKGVRVKVD
ncbi:MAG TPA: alpha-2-macroglobulin family protein [Saprospiraceae bacterium]|nr:alpha-2-macroglobulin family protein [Saprospiraceae bacterium]